MTFTPITLPLWARLVLTVADSVTVQDKETGRKTTFLKAPERRIKTQTDVDRYTAAQGKRLRKAERRKAQV